LIKWTDPDANIYQQWAVIEGPSEKDADFKRYSGDATDTGGNIVSMYLGKTDATHFLKRYNRIIIKDSNEINTTSQGKVLVRAWRIDVVDDISNKFITKISLKESYISQSELTDSEIYAVTFNNSAHLYEMVVPLSPTTSVGYVLYKERHYEDLLIDQACIDCLRCEDTTCKERKFYIRRPIKKGVSDEI
jgi:DNA-binding protein